MNKTKLKAIEKLHNLMEALNARTEDESPSVGAAFLLYSFRADKAIEQISRGRIKNAKATLKGLKALFDASAVIASAPQQFHYADASSEAQKRFEGYSRKVQSTLNTLSR